MNNLARPIVLTVDDDPDTQNLIKRYLVKNNYEVITADNGFKGLEVLQETKPDLILLDVMMPGMDGYEFCAKLQENAEMSYIPVIFVTALDEKQDKAKAFSVGAVDYLVKPIQKDALMEKVNQHADTNLRWKKIQEDAPRSNANITSFDFLKFKEFLCDQLNLSAEEKYKLDAVTHSNIYSAASEIEIESRQIAQYIADFLELPYAPYVDPYDVELGTLPVSFCRKHFVLTMKESNEKQFFVLSNPFNLEVLDILEKLQKPQNGNLNLTITQPDSIEALMKTSTQIGVKTSSEISFAEDQDKTTDLPAENVLKETSSTDLELYPVLYIANNILNTAVAERASDIHFEPKITNTIVRFRIDGDMTEMFTLKKETGIKLISRFKVLSGMDISEKRKPQDGTTEAVINDRNFKLRLATTSTPDGESLIIRLLEPYAKPKSLQELGMTEKQAEAMLEMCNRTHGLILIAGPTGCGKTTTVFSLLSQIDCKKRSLITVEDPVEYRLPSANHQQVNEKAGITFEALLKSSVRQDPDIIYLGEIRDQYSAKMSMDFSSTGHMTITTLHTSNATTAIFRLERVGITRGVMADAILGVVAQRLLKRLCPQCKEIAPISPEEAKMLSYFTDDIPSQVAHPVGCPKCNKTGYLGREGVFEILKFDVEISEMIRSGKPISEIRSFFQERGEHLISHHAIEKVKNHALSPRDVYEKILLEETRSTKETKEMPVKEKRPAAFDEDKKASILVVEDDKASQSLIKKILENRGYEIAMAQDGIEAITLLSQEHYDVIVSDVNMPNLDGFKLLEIMNQKGIETPVIFLTARTDLDDQIRGIELGAVDYITKPIEKERLLTKIQALIGTAHTKDLCSVP